MWFLKYFTKSKETEESSSKEEVQELNNDSHETKSAKAHKKPSFRRRLSRESLKKLHIIRQVGKSLRRIGDDIERRSMHGMQHTRHQSPRTNIIVT